MTTLLFKEESAELSQSHRSTIGAVRIAGVHEKHERHEQTQFESEISNLQCFCPHFRGFRVFRGQQVRSLSLHANRSI